MINHSLLDNKALSFKFNWEFGISEEIARTYLASLQKHIKAVIEAGLNLGVPESQLERHDLSKISKEEFPAYAMNFHGKTEENKAEVMNAFSKAWLHHIHENPHHWQHWIFADGFTLPHTETINGVLPMPEPYALEMVADWMGASFAYTNSWDMTNWLEKNTCKIILHPQTAEYVNSVLIGQGYESYKFNSPLAAGFSFAH